MTAEHAQVLLGERLRASRMAAGLSQQQVTDHTSIPRSAVSDIERGERRVDSLELHALATLYGQPVSHYLGEAPAVPTSTERLVQRLEQLVGDLEAHLEQRAAVLAQTYVDEMYKAARLEVDAAKRETQRQQDLVEELRRQWTATDKRLRNAEHQLGAVHPSGCERCAKPPTPTERTPR